MVSLDVNFCYIHTGCIIQVHSVFYIFLQQTFEQWRIVFWILAFAYMFGALVFMIFGTAKTLPWNSVSSQEEPNNIAFNETEAIKPLKENEFA